MLDIAARRLINPLLDRGVPILVKCRVSANMVTAFGLLPAVLSFVAIWQGYFLFGCGFILLNRLCDGLDGRLAKVLGVTDFGAYFDIVSDFLFYGLVVLGFIFYAPEDNALAGGFLLFCFLGTGASFMMYGIMGFVERLPDRWGGDKGFYFVGGLIEGSETILFFILFCLFPNYFSPLAIIFGVLCLLTIALRLWAAYMQASGHCR